MNGKNKCLAVLMILAMISTLQCLPIEVVYTGGDNCDCPKSLNYLVNIPPPPETKENPRYEHGYKLEVPPPPKGKVTYSFDFTVQEPIRPLPVEDEKLNLYAKVDRITAHKKDCVVSAPKRSPACSCGEKCTCSRCRYVSSAVDQAEIFRRNLATYEHPNSVRKSNVKRRHPFLTWAAIITPVKGEGDPTYDDFSQAKTRRRRDLSKFFGLSPRKSYLERKPERTVKQYKKRLSSYKRANDVSSTTTTTTTPTPDILPKFVSSFIPFTAFPALPTLDDIDGPLTKLGDMMFDRGLRSKRDIKGEYDLLEKERDQLDLTLPEIIQFMPETLDPNFKRGQCQFASCRQFEELPNMDDEQLLKHFNGNKVTTESPNSSEEKTEDHHSDIGDDGSGDDNIENSPVDNHDGGDSNSLSSLSTVKKRNAGPYGCVHFTQFSSPAPPAESYFVQGGYGQEDNSYYPLNSNAYGFNPYLPAVGPSQAQYNHDADFFSAQYSKPAVALSHSLEDEVQVVADPHYRTFTPVNGYYSDAHLDQIIADIVRQHVALIETSQDDLYQGPVFDRSPPAQDHETATFLKFLAEGRFNRIFGAADKTYTFPAPNFYPNFYSSP